MRVLFFGSGCFTACYIFCLFVYFVTPRWGNLNPLVNTSEALSSCIFATLLKRVSCHHTFVRSGRIPGRCRCAAVARAVHRRVGLVAGSVAAPRVGRSYLALRAGTVVPHCTSVNHHLHQSPLHPPPPPCSYHQTKIMWFGYLYQNSAQVVTLLRLVLFLFNESLFFFFLRDNT